MSSHVVILGCARSGTSIFGELFESIPGYTYYSEPPFESLRRPELEGPTAVKVPRESPEHASTPGLSFPLEALLATLPEPRKVYWIVRHPLDVVASLKVGIAKEWGHHPRPPDWREWQDRPLAQRCAHHWSYVNGVGFNAVNHLVEVRYFEKMLREPLAFACETCRGVGVEPDAIAGALRNWAERVQDENNEKFIEARTSRPYSRPDHRRRVGRWKENLDAMEVSAIVPMLKDVAKHFGYSL